MTGISSSATNSSNGGSATQGGLDAVRNPRTDQVDVSTNERNRLTAQTPTSLDSLSASPSTTDVLADSPSTSDTLSGKVCDIPGSSPTDSQVDEFHACTTGVTDQQAIDNAQEQTKDGGCAALSDSAMLCNPAGPEIGEYTVGRPENFPDYIGPNAGFSHLYRAEANTPGGWSSLVEQINTRISEVPTPGSNQNTATPQGVINDAGINPMENTDLVRSSVSTDVQGRPVVSNVTIPGRHMLDPGVVSQTAWSDGNATQAIAVGEGNGIASVPANVFAEFVFEEKLEADIRVAITRDTAQ